MDSVRKIRIGTRGSPLALRQTEMVRAELARVRPEIETEVVTILTSGDWKPEQGEVPLNAKGGGKALFAKEIEEQLLAGKIDAAVHSMKDMESVLPKGLSIVSILPREDARDVVVLGPGFEGIKSLEELPKNFRMGTCSVRRQGFLLAARPDLKIEPLRGNVGTRLQKLQDGKFDGIVLAYAGLNRLGLADRVSFFLPVGQMLPAVAQGAIGIEISDSYKKLMAIFGHLNCDVSAKKIGTERAALAALGGSCHTPIGAYATVENDQIHLRLKLISPDGKKSYEQDGRSVFADGEKLGRELGLKLKEIAPKELL